MLDSVKGSLAIAVNGEHFVVPAERLAFRFVESQQLEQGLERYYVARLSVPGVEQANVCVWERPAGRFARLELDAPIEVELKENRLGFTFRP